MQTNDTITEERLVSQPNSGHCKIKPLPPDFALSEAANRRPLIPPTSINEILRKMKVRSLTDANTYEENR
jgi:hypothetical protein